MVLRQRIISEIYDESSDKVVNREIITDKEIKKPKVIEDLGYNHKEQIDVLQGVQDSFLFTQSSMMGPEQCSVCGSITTGSGRSESDFHAIYTDHRLKIPRKVCCNKSCSKRSNDTVHSLFGSNMHPDLVEKQTKIAATNSFMNCQKILEGENGRYRKVNNQLTIKKTAEKVGIILDSIHQKGDIDHNDMEADQLIAQVDGGYIKSKDKNNRSFEVLLSQIYNPENYINGGVSKNGYRKSGKILDKLYSASALKDRGKTIRKMTFVAAKKQGMTTNTKITALSDGAKNCWSTLKVLEKHCASIDYILDWYHIKQRFDVLISRTEDPYTKDIESIKWKIWHGDSAKAIEKLSNLYIKLLDSDCADKAHDLLKYLVNNKKYLTDYEERRTKSLVYTSSIIESSIETLVNTRHKKKHKAQWTRDGAHNILQIRTAIAGKQWDNEWQDVKQQYYKIAA